MASKNQRRGGATGGASPRDEVDRLIAKGRYKDAVRQAKICQRDLPSTEHHRLLEQAYLLRARELNDGGMATASREVAGHLLAFGITDPGLIEPSATLLLALGMAADALKLQGRLDSPEAIARLARQVADQAVLHPDRSSSSSPEIASGAKRVRSALEALAAGDESGAMDGLRDLARSSPFADWRLFARGLAASRRGSHAEARANWDRLDPARAASRIALALLSATEDTPAGGPADLSKRERLERWAFGEPLLGPLRELAEAAARGDWADVVRKVGPLRFALRRLDPALAARLTQALISPLTGEAMDLDYRQGRGLIQTFTKAAEPLPIDPCWDRLWALIWEGPQGHIDEAEPFWRRYLANIEAVPAIRPEECDRARGLVLTHLGEGLADSAADSDPGPAGPGLRRSAPEADRDRRRAVACLEESLQLFPSHRATYRALMDVFEDAGQPDRVAEVAGRLLEALPDDFDALIQLADYHFQRDEPGQSLPFALRARKLRPLDRKTTESEWACRVALARQHALQGRWAEGRTELLAAGRLLPDLSEQPHFAARMAAFETRAGRADIAIAIVDEALARLPEPAPFRLAMAIEARRFRLPDGEIARADALWAGETSKKVRGDTAGALAGLIGSFLAGQIDYPGRDEHARQVADYLRRTTRIKYGRDDLAHACSFLSLLESERELCEKLAKRGPRLFPDAPEFPLILGSIEMEKGPSRGDLGAARRHFEAALNLALRLEATDPKAAAIIPKVKGILSALNEVLGGPSGFPFAFGGPPGRAKSSPRGMLDAIAEMMGAGIDPDDLFGPLDDDEPDDDPPSPAPKPRSKPKPKGKKR